MLPGWGARAGSQGLLGVSGLGLWWSPFEMGRWRVRWEWGGTGVKEDDEVSPQKVKFEVPAGHPSRDPEAHVSS